MRNIVYSRKMGGHLACSFFRFLLLGIVLVGVQACGRKGPPKPPEETAPSPVRSLQVLGKVDGVMLRWFAPDTDASGDELLDLAGFVVRKNKFREDKQVRFKAVKEIELTEEEVKQGLKTAEEEKRFVFLDEDVEAGKTYDYAVFPYNEDGVEGRASQILRVKFIGEASTVELLR